MANRLDRWTRSRVPVGPRWDEVEGSVRRRCRRSDHARDSTRFGHERSPLVWHGDRRGARLARCDEKARLTIRETEERHHRPGGNALRSNATGIRPRPPSWLCGGAAGVAQAVARDAGRPRGSGRFARIGRSSRGARARVEGLGDLAIREVVGWPDAGLVIESSRVRPSTNLNSRPGAAGSTPAERNSAWIDGRDRPPPRSTARLVLVCGYSVFRFRKKGRVRRDIGDPSRRPNRTR